MKILEEVMLFGQEGLQVRPIVKVQNVVRASLADMAQAESVKL